MTKRDPRVNEYVAAAAPFARPILRRLRALVHRSRPGATETIKWGMPFFQYEGNLCYMAAFKAHCAFGFWRRKMLLKPGEAKGGAMGQLGRITSVRDLPSDSTLRRWVQSAAKLNADLAKGRRKKLSRGR